jgi:DNA ligase (NAD+)
VFLWCDAAGCDGRAKAVVLAHAREMGIDEVGPGLVDRLFAAGKAGKIRFSDAADLYALTERDLLKVEGFAERSAEKVVGNIRARMEVGLPTFVASLGIPGVGVRMMEKFGSKDLDGLMRMVPVDFKKAEGVGDRMAAAIVEGLSKNYHLIGRLLANGVRIKAKRKAAAKGNALGGKSFCFTGDIKELNPDTGKPWDRDEAWALVEENGGVVKSGVSKKLDVLVMADPGSASSKARKAREYGVEMISAAEFLRRVGA